VLPGPRDKKAYIIEARSGIYCEEAMKARTARSLTSSNCCVSRLHYERQCWLTSETRNRA